MANVFGGGGSKGGSGISSSGSTTSSQNTNVSRSTVRQFGTKYNTSPVRPVSNTTSSQSTGGGQSLFNQYGTSGSISPIQSPNTCSPVQNETVSSTVLKQCNTSGGINSILTVSPDALENFDNQVYSSTPNNYSRAGTEFPVFDLRDFYTKADIHRLLKTKADVTSVYKKAEVDAAISALNSQINQSLTAYITSVEVDNKISQSYNQLLSYVEDNFYEKSLLYTKSEVNSLLQSLSLGTEFVVLEPNTTERNIIDPKTNNAVALTIKASSNPEVTTVQHWIDDQSNSIGRIRKSGQVEFYGNMVLGQTIESWRPALDVSEKRISGVADPIHGLDAINKDYLEEFVLSAIITSQLDVDKIFDIDCLVY
jgi:hypothetical protein